MQGEGTTIFSKSLCKNQKEKINTYLTTEVPSNFRMYATHNTRVYPKVSGLATWIKNCKS